MEGSPITAICGYRAPNVSINRSVRWAHEVLDELGFQYDSNVYPIRHELYGKHRGQTSIHGANLMEIPLATWRVFDQNLPVVGGAYLRILPYMRTKNCIRALNDREHSPAVLYLHPWEIDHSQPRLQAS